MKPGSEFEPTADVKAAQCLAVLAALQAQPRTTSELRTLIGCMSPASRVYQLKKAGHVIVTTRKGRQARYVLIEGNGV